MTSFLDFERANNTLLAALNKPEFAEIVNLAIKYKGTIFIPQLVSISQIEITPQFVGAHIYVTNPANRNEFVTLNGCVGVFTMRNDLKVLNIIDMVRPFTIADLTGNIFSRRQLFEVTEYKQSIQVLRNAEIQVGKQLMIINLIASPIGTWKQNTQQVDMFAMANHKTAPNTNKLEQKSKSLPKIPATTSKADMKNPKDQFFAKMKDPSAAKIANYIKRFLGGFLQSPPAAEEQSNAIQQFREKVLNALAVHPLWKTLPPAEFDATAETLEKYVMTKLYSCCFAPSIEEIQKDKEFAKRLSRLQFLTPANFDIDPIHQNESKYQMAMNELRKMNAYKAPRDKLICILNCSKVIFSILNRGRSVLDSETGSADHFLPILIYITLKANPPSIYSNLQYILRFRDQQKLASETAYYYAQVELAVMFLSELDATRVTIDPLEFERQFNKGIENNGSNNTTTNNTGTTTPDSKTSANTKAELLMDFDSWDTTQPSQTSSPAVKTPTKPMEIKSRVGGTPDPMSTNGSNMGIDEDIISVEASSLDSESSWDSFVSAPTMYGGTGSHSDITEVDKESDEIIYDSDGSIKAASLSKLIESITAGDDYDIRVSQEVLLCYRYFITPQEFLERLLRRFYILAPRSMNELEARNVCTRIQLRVINLIKSWLQTYPDDFKEDNEMVRKIKDFLKSANERPELKVLIHQVTSKALSVLETIVDKFIFDMQQEAFHRTPQAEMALSTPEWNLSKFLDSPPEDIARHFDALDWQNFMRVKPWEFLTVLNLNEQRAPHMFKYKQMSKFRSDWITTIIVLEKDVETRKKMIALFIDVAMSSLDRFNHFNALAILSALTDEAVDRLRETWKLLPTTTLKRFDELKKVSSNAKANLERFVACVPSVDITEIRMREIESLDQAIANNLVHMKKMTALADLVRLLFKFQESNPKARVSKSFEEWFENNLVLDAKTRLEKSIELQSNSAQSEPNSSNVQTPAGTAASEKSRGRAANVSNRSTTMFTSSALNEANIPSASGTTSARATIHAEPTGLRTALDEMAEGSNTEVSADKPAENKPSEPVSLRTNVTRELLHTERTYVESLELLLKVAVPMLRTRAIIPEDKIKVLIANAEVILNFHKTFVHEMEKMACTPPFKVGDVFLKYYQYFSMYVEYVNNYNKSSELLDKLRKKNKAWAAFEEEMQNSAEFRMEDFDSLLIKPIQRLTKYGLLLNEIKKHTEKSHPDYESVQIAWQKMTMMADHANQAKREAEQLARAVEIENLLTDYNGPQITQDRKYCGETKCYLLSTREIIEAAIIFWSDSVMFVKPHSITIGALTLSSQLQFLGLFNTIALTLKKLTKQEVNKKMPNLEMSKMPDDLDVQALSYYASIQTGTDEIIAAFAEKQDHQNFFESFATVRKAIQERTWKPVENQPNTPSPRQYHTAVAIGKKIYIFGGNDRKSNYFNELYSFDTETRVWEKKVPNQRGCKPPVLSRHSAASYGKKIYFFGGQNLENPFLNDTYTVDIETLSWQKLNTTGNIPSIRVSHTSSVVGNKMYVIGGYFFKSITQQNAYNDVFCLDLATNVWTMIEPNGAVPPARFGHWAVVLDKKIYIFGGKTIDHKAMNDMFVFDTETNTWTQQITAVGFVPIARSEASAALLPGTKTIVMFGGISINTLAFQDVFYFDTETCEWQVAWFDVPLEPVHAHTLSIIDDTMYIFGGRLIRPDDFELPLLNDLIPVSGISSMTTNVNDYQRKKSAVYQKGIFGDLSKMKIYCTTLPPRDETKQLPNESFNIIQKQVTFNWDDNIDALEFEEKLEDSSFGEVWKASYKRGDSAETTVAVQVLQGAYSREKYQGLKQAMDTINKCRHQNLFSYFGTSSVNSDVWILQEICSGVHLKDLMRLTSKPFTELQIATVCAEVLKALAYLHGRHLVHKHLRASTILLTDACQLKLTDYNLCDQLYTMTGLVDSDASAWSAPEVGEKGCSDKSDIWSLGATVVELLENVLPASIICRQFLKNTKVSQEIRDFVTKCMSKVPDKRPDAVELLKHPFIKQARNLDTLRPLVDISKKKRVNMKPVPKASSHVKLPTANSRSIFSISDVPAPSGHANLASSSPLPNAQEDKIRREYEEKLAQQQALINQLLKKQEELEQQLRDAQNTIKQLQQPNGEKFLTVL